MITLRLLNNVATMTERGTTTIASGQNALNSLIEGFAEKTPDWNEAETRFHFIDRFIIECLGWRRDEIRVEKREDRTYTDYELGLPRRAIWEAKREGRSFELPATFGHKITADLPSLLALGSEVAEAIGQVQTYCIRRGVETAVLTNGRQLIAFLATRVDGIPPLEGRCLIIDGHPTL
jgi:hypothetical protein